MLEYCRGGSLIDIVSSRGETLNELEVQHVVVSVLLGLKTLHGRNMAHTVSTGIVYIGLAVFLTHTFSCCVGYQGRKSSVD